MYLDTRKTYFVVCALARLQRTAPILDLWKNLLDLNSTTKSQKITAINATRSNFSSLFLTTKILIFNRTFSRISFQLLSGQTQQNFSGGLFCANEFSFLLSVLRISHLLCVLPKPRVVNSKWIFFAIGWRSHVVGTVRPTLVIFPSVSLCSVASSSPLGRLLCF